MSKENKNNPPQAETDQTSRNPVPSPQKKEAEKPVKVPKIFSAQMSTYTLEKKILSRIPLPLEKQFIKDLYTYPPGADLPKKLSRKNPGPLLNRPLSLDKKQKTRLKKLAKDIKSNRGFFSPVKAMVLLLIFGGIAIFFTFYQDRIIQSAFESNISRIAGAPAVFDGFRVRLFNTGVWFDRLQIADSQDISRNSIDIKGVSIDMDTELLLKGQFHIRSFGAESLEIGTQRQVTPARDREILAQLAEADAKKREQASPMAESESESESDQQGSEEQSTSMHYARMVSEMFSFDGGAVLQAVTGSSNLEALGKTELDNLATPHLITETIDWVQESLESSQSQVVSIEQRLRSVSSDIGELESQWNRARTSVTDAIELANKSKNILTESQNLVRQTEVFVNDARTFTQSVQPAIRDIEDQVQRDLNYLENRAGELISLTVNNPVDALVIPILSERALSYLPIIERAQGILTKIRSSQGAGTSSPVPSDRRGRRVVLDPGTRPAFLMDRAFFRFIGDRTYSLNLQNLSSHPDRIDEIGQIELGFDQNQETIRLVSEIRPVDSGLEILTTGELNRADYSLELPPGILPASSVEGNLTLDGGISVFPDGNVLLTVGISITDQRFTRIGNDENSVGERVLQAIERLESLDVLIQGNSDGLSLVSNTGPELAREAEALAREQIAELTEYLQREAEKFLAPYLAEIERMENQIRSYETQIDGYLVEARRYRTRINNLEKEITDAITALIPPIPTLDDAREALNLPDLPDVENVPGIQDLPPIPTLPTIPSIPTPSLPSVPGFRRP